MGLLFNRKRGERGGKKVEDGGLRKKATKVKNSSIQKACKIEEGQSWENVEVTYLGNALSKYGGTEVRKLELHVLITSANERW